MQINNNLNYHNNYVPSSSEILNNINNGSYQPLLTPEDTRIVDFCKSQFDQIKAGHVLRVAAKKNELKHMIKVVRNPDNSFTFIPLALLAQAKKGWVSTDDLNFFRNTISLYTNHQQKMLVEKSIDESNGSLINNNILKYLNHPELLSNEDKAIVDFCVHHFKCLKNFKASPEEAEDNKPLFKHLIKIDTSNNKMEIIPYGLIGQASCGWVSNADLNNLRNQIHKYTDIPQQAAPATSAVASIQSAQLPIAPLARNNIHSGMAQQQAPAPVAISIQSSQLPRATQVNLRDNIHAGIAQQAALASAAVASVNSKKLPKVSILPHQYYCPLTKNVIKEPVIGPDGVTYEKKAIADYVLTHHKSPTNPSIHMEVKDLYPNRALKSLIDRSWTPEKKEEETEEFISPIYYGIMKDPCIAPDGHTYERADIVKWMNEHGTSPITRMPMTAAQLYTNKALQGLINRNG